MCGIAGMLLHDPLRRANAAVVVRMAERLRHRGPDDEGAWSDGPIALAHRRLSVIDLSARGRQPMSNEDGSIWVVLNGEIYDHGPLRAELLARGHVFRSESDTEVLVHLYEEHSVGFLERINGMFALALWDGRERRLLLARDRLGEKPLFYHEAPEALRFASEPRALLADPAVPAEPDLPALDHYLARGYVPSPSAAFRGMRKLPPAHALIVHRGRTELRRYWSPRYIPKRRAREEDLAAELRGLLRDAVRRRLVSDVPVGALLSGGLDSSLVVALMREAGVARLRTFSIGFEEQRYDELHYARMVARAVASEHEERIVRPDAAKLLPCLVRHYGEPFADASALPTFQLCEMARASVTVALSGDGGDESFAGYDRHLAFAWSRPLERLPSGLWASLARFCGRMAGRADPKSLVRAAARLLEGLSLSPSERYARWTGVFDPAARARLLTPEFTAQLVREREQGRAELEDLFAGEQISFTDAALRADLLGYLPDDLLVKVDIASMAHGLEVRAPLLDHRIVEFAATLPAGMKLRRLTGKVLLRRVARSLLPASILTRRKMGFGVPIDRWLRCELREMVHDLLLDARARARGLLRSGEVARLLREHAAGVGGHHARLWALLVLELWHRELIDGAAAPPGERVSECAA